MNRRTPVMVLNDLRYVEKKPAPNITTPAGDCAQCALGGDGVGCWMAVSGAAHRAFGGDCEQRDVVYVRERDVIRAARASKAGAPA